MSRDIVERGTNYKNTVANKPQEATNHDGSHLCFDVPDFTAAIID